MLSWADCKATCWLLVPGLTARHPGKKNTRGGLTSNQDFFEDDLSTSTNLLIQKTQEGIIFFHQNWECLRMHPAVVHTWGKTLLVTFFHLVLKKFIIKSAGLTPGLYIIKNINIQHCF